VDTAVATVRHHRRDMWKLLVEGDERSLAKPSLDLRSGKAESRSRSSMSAAPRSGTCSIPASPTLPANRLPVIIRTR
jgi:hypothetical protein